MPLLLDYHVTIWYHSKKEGKAKTLELSLFEREPRRQLVELSNLILVLGPEDMDEILSIQIKKTRRKHRGVQDK